MFPFNLVFYYTNPKLFVKKTVGVWSLSPVIWKLNLYNKILQPVGEFLYLEKFLVIVRIVVNYLINHLLKKINN